MIDKRLIGMMGDSKRYIAKKRGAAMAGSGRQWASDLCVVSRYLGALYDQLTIGDTMAGAPNLPLTLGIVAAALLRTACTCGAAAASYNASRTVKKDAAQCDLRKLLRLGGSYTQAVPTAEVLQLAGEGVEQLETLLLARTCRSFSTPCWRLSPCLWCWPRSA